MSDSQLEKNANKAEKYRVFMGSIMVCVVYAIVAIVMILAIYFTEAGKELDKSLGTFTRTFAIGTFLIIIIITFLILDWKPSDKKKEKRDVINAKSCPDYWKNTTSDISEINRATLIQNNVEIYKNGNTIVNLKDYGINNGNKNLFNNKCENNKDVIDSKTNMKLGSIGFQAAVDDSSDFNTQDSKLKLKDITTNTEKTYSNFFNDNQENRAKLIAGLGTMNTIGLTDTDDTAKALSLESKPAGGADGTYYFDNSGDGYGNISCSTVYPEYLADLDRREYAHNNYSGPTNRYRCEYSKLCGVPWTEIGCDE